MTTVQDHKTISFEERLKQLQLENRALREQLLRAQRLATVGTMTAMIAHEFNNILTPIINYAHLAQTNPNLTEKAILRAADGGERASTICQAILGVVRDDQGQPAETNLAELAASTLAAMARDPKRDGIELSCRIPRDLTFVTRRVHLQQVLLNLLMNARTAILAGGKRSGRIEIAARWTAREVRISVSDTGVGIPPENLDRIFEPFFTTRPEADRSSGGHGLGLAICREIVTSMNGRIAVRSTVGEGTTFTVHIPH